MFIEIVLGPQSPARASARLATRRKARRFVRSGAVFAHVSLTRRGFDVPSSDDLRARDCNEVQLLEIQRFAIGRPGGYSGAAAPDPIPNSAVKRPSAYDTSSQDAGKSVAARSANRKTFPSSSSQDHPKTPRSVQTGGAFCVDPHPRRHGLTESRNHVKRTAGRETAPVRQARYRTTREAEVGPENLTSRRRGLATASGQPVQGRTGRMSKQRRAAALLELQ